MTSKNTMRYVLDYDTVNVLEGVPSDELVAASDAAGDTGAVPAYRDVDGVWQYVAPSMRDQYRRMGHDVITVYVEA